jgi:hypothetical protein
MNADKRRKLGFIFIIILGLVIGRFIKNVEIGLIIGLLLGVFAGGLVRQ